ncbi:MAG: alkaline phosphatase [Caldilineales bacterium]|nr:alkaline phosphatase [Caldilineales bacterium]MDW8317976.1 alkaline phosphatase [Anaerolineae bacterium]
MRCWLAVLVLSLALSVLVGAPASTGQGPAGFDPCTSWAQVNDDAFGLDTGFDDSYAGEEGFEVAVFREQLYVGMEADNRYGARLWRTRAGVVAPSGQQDWEEVIADPAGRPFGNPNITQNDHVDSLAVFDGYLYVSTANGGASTFGTQVWRSASGDPGAWSQVNPDGFGDIYNTNFKDMQVFDGWLCGGTRNPATGAQVWCTADGVSWVRKNRDGFGRPEVVTVWSGGVYNGALYFGVQDRGAEPGAGDDVARLYRARSLDGMPTWEEVYSGPPGSRRANLLAALGGYLYVAVRSPQGVVVLRSATGDAGTWEVVSAPGMGPGGSASFDSVVDGAAVYNGALYVAVSNTTTGVEVWRTVGLRQANGLVDWTPVGGSGLGDPHNVHAELILFHGDLYAWTSNYAVGQQVRRAHCPAAQQVVLLIGDGMGANHLAAANLYTGRAPAYQSWRRAWAATYPAGGRYDPVRAWSEFDYVAGDATDSAAAATALATGQKTAVGRISASADGVRLFSLADKARALGRGVGAVTSVYLSDATPGAWYAHNLSRANGYAIADEGLWGDPNTTGSPATSPYYGGGLGATHPPADVLIGAGHPAWNGANYVNATMRDRLLADAGSVPGFAFVERVAGSADGGPRLLAAAADPATARLVGLFGGRDGHLEYRLADSRGANPENPTLAQMAQAALAVLSRRPAGFVLLVEGGAMDWASHDNRLDPAIGEVLDFNAAVQAVADWVDDPATLADWSNTLVIVTADHETGYLTAAPGAFPDRPLGPVTAQALALEKVVRSTGRRASWDDADGDGEVDAGERVYWAWNSAGHTNSLVPVYVRGAGAELLAAQEAEGEREAGERKEGGGGWDPVRGAYVDNTDLFRLMDAVTTRAPEPPQPEPPAAPRPTIALSGRDAVLTWPAVPGAVAYEVWRGRTMRLNPGDPGATLTVVPAPAGDPVHFVDRGAAADPQQNVYYAVRSVGPGGKSAVGPRVSLAQARAPYRAYLPLVGR